MSGLSVWLRVGVTPELQKSHPDLHLGLSTEHSPIPATATSKVGPAGFTELFLTLPYDSKSSTLNVMLSDQALPDWQPKLQVMLAAAGHQVQEAKALTSEGDELTFWWQAHSLEELGPAPKSGCRLYVEGRELTAGSTLTGSVYYCQTSLALKSLVLRCSGRLTLGEPLTRHHNLFNLEAKVISFDEGKLLRLHLPMGPFAVEEGGKPPLAKPRELFIPFQLSLDPDLPPTMSWGGPWPTVTYGLELIAHYHGIKAPKRTSVTLTVHARPANTAAVRQLTGAAGGPAAKEKEKEDEEKQEEPASSTATVSEQGSAQEEERPQGGAEKKKLGKKVSSSKNRLSLDLSPELATGESLDLSPELATGESLERPWRPWGRIQRDGLDVEMRARSVGAELGAIFPCFVRIRNHSSHSITSLKLELVETLCVEFSYYATHSTRLLRQATDVAPGHSHRWELALPIKVRGPSLLLTMESDRMHMNHSLRLTLGRGFRKTRFNHPLQVFVAPRIDQLNISPAKQQQLDGKGKASPVTTTLHMFRPTLPLRPFAAPEEAKRVFFKVGLEEHLTGAYSPSEQTLELAAEPVQIDFAGERGYQEILDL